MPHFKKTKDIKVGAIGYGGAFNMGRGHLNEMAATGMIPSVVVDPDKSRLVAAQEDFPGIETYTSIATMLKKSDVNLLTIITPHNLHAKQVVQCLRAGRHVVVEKPMAVTTKECDTMIAEAKKQKVVLSTYHNRHWDGCILQAVQALRSKAIGDVVRVSVNFGNRGLPGDWWRSSKKISGGLLYDWGVHLIEYALQIIDGDLTEVTGFLKEGYWAKQCSWKKDTIEDDGTIVARFANGRWLMLNMTSLDPLPGREWFEIIGTEGTYTFNPGQWTIVKPGKDGTLVTTQGANPPAEGQKFYDNIAAHLAKGKKLVITPEWARRPIHIIDLACRSAKQGKALKAEHK